MFSRLSLSKSTAATIEWEMTPDLAFCTFSAKGLRDDLSNTGERICYFFIDNYGASPRLYLMERGTRYVNILAEITAPVEMMTASIIDHGSSLSSKDNFPVSEDLKNWLIREVVERENSPYLVPTVLEDEDQEDFGPALPGAGTAQFTGEILSLPSGDLRLNEAELKAVILQWNFFDAQINPAGSFENALAAADDRETVIDERTGLMWQRSGLDLCSIRKMTGQIKELNREGFAGFHDWRMPGVEEAMSLMEAEPNAKSLHLHPCFSREQPFIFVAAKRNPTGFWFVDYKQGKAYWSSGTVPGGFCRLCRSFSIHDDIRS